MGRNPRVSVNDFDEPVKRGGVEDTRNYGDEAECAVCGVPLGRAPHVEGIDLCDEHTEQQDHYEEH